MSFDLVAWKWASEEGGSNPREVYERLLDQKEHPAVVVFDEKTVSRAIRREFGDVNNEEGGPFLFFPGFMCIIFNVSREPGDAAIPRLKKVLASQNLFCYDPGIAG